MAPSLWKDFHHTGSFFKVFLQNCKLHNVLMATTTFVSCFILMYSIITTLWRTRQGHRRICSAVKVNYYTAHHLWRTAGTYWCEGCVDHQACAHQGNHKTNCRIIYHIIIVVFKGVFRTLSVRAMCKQRMCVFVICVLTPRWQRWLNTKIFTQCEANDDMSSSAITMCDKILECFWTSEQLLTGWFCAFVSCPISLLHSSYTCYTLSWFIVRLIFCIFHSTEVTWYQLS